MVVVVDFYSMFLSLLAGLFSTLVMSIFEIPFWRKWGLEGVLEWHENQVLFSKFFKTNRMQINFPGLFFLHLWSIFELENSVFSRFPCN